MVLCHYPPDLFRVSLSENVGTETAQLVEEVRRAGGRDYWNTRVRPALLKSEP